MVSFRYGKGGGFVKDEDGRVFGVIWLPDLKGGCALLSVMQLMKNYM